MRLLAVVKAKQIPAAVVTASRDCGPVIAAAGLADGFTVCVEGTEAAERSLPNKPDQAMFLEAARRVEVSPADAVLLDASVARVEAGHGAGFALVVGVDRRGQGQQLAESGADVVLTSLVELESVLPSGAHASHAPVSGRERHWAGGANKVRSTGWHLVFGDFDPLHEATREALCALGNGYWGTRGAVPGSTCDGIHYPGTYLAGVYNRLTDQLNGRTVETEHRVNAPDWTFLTVRLADGAVLQIATGRTGDAYPPSRSGSTVRRTHSRRSLSRQRGPNHSRQLAAIRVNVRTTFGRTGSDRRGRRLVGRGRDRIADQRSGLQSQRGRRRTVGAPAFGGSSILTGQSA